MLRKVFQTALAVEQQRCTLQDEVEAARTLFGQVKGGAAVEADAEQQDARLEIDQPRQRGGLAQAALEAVAGGDECRPASPGGEQIAW